MFMFRRIFRRTPASPSTSNRRTPASPSTSNRRTLNDFTRGNDWKEFWKVRAKRLVPEFWKVVKLKNIPKEDPLQSNFNNGGKVIKLSRKEGGRVYSEYYTLDSLAGMVGMYLRQTYNQPNSNFGSDWVTPMIYFMDDDLIVFKHPFTRKNVRRRNVEFVIMKKKTNAARATVQRSAAKKRKRS